MAAKLQERKLRHVADTGASIVATANPGCILQLESGVRKFSTRVAVRHPISLLAEAYRSEDKETVEVRREDRLGSKQIWKGVGVL